MVSLLIEKTDTSPSLHGLVSYRGRSQPLSLARDSGAVSNLYTSPKLPSLFLATPRQLQCAGSCQHSETVETEASPSDGTWKSWDIGHTAQLFPSPGRSWDLWVFPHLFCAEPAWRVVGGNGESLHANPNYCLCSQWPPSSWSMSGPVSALRDRSHVLGQPPEKLKHQPHGPALTLPRGKLGPGFFASAYTGLSWGEGLW